MSARRRKLSPVGNSWYNGLHVEGMHLPDPTITALCFFNQAPSKDAIVRDFEKHIWPMDRFSSVVQNGYWVKEEKPMDVDYHFVEQTVEDEAAIDAFAQDVMSKPLDRSKPMWTVTVLSAKEGRSAVVLRVHHVIGDGLGLLFSFFPMMQCEEGDVRDKMPLPAILLGKRSERTGARPGVLSKICSAIFGCPKRMCTGCRGALSLLIVPYDSDIKINPPQRERKPFLPYSGRQTFTRMTPVPMPLIKEVRAKHGCTVNDAIMSALSGAIRRYCAQELNDPLCQADSRQPLSCKCTMLMAMPRPVDPSDPSKSLCNNILTPLFKLPVGEKDPAARLQKSMAMSADLKQLPFIAGVSATTKFVSAVAPAGLSKKIASEALSKLTCNVTCLPMSTVPVTSLGQQIQELQVLFVNNIPQVSLMTYNGMLYWNIICDSQLVPDPAALGRHFLAEMQDLAAGPAME